MSKYISWAADIICRAIESGLTGSLTIHFQSGKLMSIERREIERPPK